MTDSVGVMQSRWETGVRDLEEGRVLAAPSGAAADERELVTRCRSGEEAAFRELLQRYRGRALFLAAHLLGDWNEAEDVVQEAFLRVFRSIRSFRGEAAFYSWLYRIVVNLCRDRGRRADARLTVPLDEARDADGAGDWGATRLQIEALLTRLSKELRVTLLLREVVGLSYAEIAEELDVPVGTVRSRLSAAREQFRRLWEESGEP